MNSGTSSLGSGSVGSSKPGSLTQAGTKKSKAPQPTVVWGICGTWLDPNHTPGQHATTTEESNAVISIPPSQILDTAASRRYFQSSVAVFQPICVAFHVGACGNGAQCEQLHVQRQYLTNALANKNACCGSCGDAFTNQLLADVPELNHLTLDLVIVSGAAVQAADATMSVRNVAAAQYGAPGRPVQSSGIAAVAPPTSTDAAHQSTMVATTPQPLVALADDPSEALADMPPILDFEFDTTGISAVDENATKPVRATDTLASLAGDSLALAQLPMMRQIRMTQTCITTALQRGEPALCVDHLILRGGCPRAKDCSKFHLCRKMWQQVHAQLSAGGSVQIRVSAEPQ